MNSFKSACSFAKRTPVTFDQFEEDVEPFLGCQVGVELVVRRFSVFKAVKHLNDALHSCDFTTVGLSAAGCSCRGAPLAAAVAALRVAQLSGPAAAINGARKRVRCIAASDRGARSASTCRLT